MSEPFKNLKDDPIQCECLAWGNDRIYLLGRHHYACNRAARINPLLDRALVEALVDGMDTWAQDEDGIHFDAWAAYKAGCEALGRRIVKERA